jgi:hypothetical protein
MSIKFVLVLLTRVLCHLLDIDWIKSGALEFDYSFVGKHSSLSSIAIGRKTKESGRAIVEIELLLRMEKWPLEINPCIWFAQNAFSFNLLS